MRVQKVDPTKFHQWMKALLIIGDPPNDDVFLDPHAAALGAVLPVWFEMPFPILVTARACGLPAARVVLCAIQTSELTKPWWPELRTVLSYAQSLQMMRLINSLSLEESERIFGCAEAATHEYGFKQSLEAIKPEWCILCDLHRDFGKDGVDGARAALQCRINTQERYFADTVNRLVEVVPITV